jgi:hypothetical protein
MRTLILKYIEVVERIAFHYQQIRRSAGRITPSSFSFPMSLEFVVDLIEPTAAPPSFLRRRPKLLEVCFRPSASFAGSGVSGGRRFANTNVFGRFQEVHTP